MNNTPYIWSLDPILAVCFQNVFERNKQMKFKDEQMRQLTECIAETVVSVKTVSRLIKEGGSGEH